MWHHKKIWQTYTGIKFKWIMCRRFNLDDLKIWEEIHERKF